MPPWDESRRAWLWLFVSIAGSAVRRAAVGVIAGIAVGVVVAGGGRSPRHAPRFCG